MKWIIIIVILVGFPLAMYTMYKKAAPKEQTEIFSDKPSSSPPSPSASSPSLRSSDFGSDEEIPVIRTNPDSPSNYPSAADGSGNDFKPGDLSPFGLVEGRNGSAVRVVTKSGEKKFLKTTFQTPRVENFTQFGFFKRHGVYTLATKEFGTVRPGQQIPEGVVLTTEDGLFDVRRSDGSITRYMRATASVARPSLNTDATPKDPDWAAKSGGGSPRGEIPADSVRPLALPPTDR
jgi:hypothetical protein